ncbi:MAG: diaminopimelate epimerase [Bacteroidales bacterium]|nr:diaminopimelate epimerase [Bacteroidales bacterium]
MELYKYQGAGNDFLIADNRKGLFHPTAAEIEALCDRHYGIGADGLMLLEPAPTHTDDPNDRPADPKYDFKMVYFNSDGSGGMMCGNGGRCITAFAADLGIRPRNGSKYEFVADDGPHSAEILFPTGDEFCPCKPSDDRPVPAHCKTIRLKMVDVEKITNIDVKSFYLNTGTRHFVKFVSILEDYNVLQEGRFIRNMPQFAPIGTNVNFVEAEDGILHVRTYEKGVENETFACGTGITASAIAAVKFYEIDPERRPATGKAIHRDGNRIHINVRALRDDLAVDFTETAKGAEDVWLTGPATFVGKITLPE